jgi:hypothetical protein
MKDLIDRALKVRAQASELYFKLEDIEFEKYPLGSPERASLKLMHDIMGDVTDTFSIFDARRLEELKDEMGKGA